MKKVGLLGGTFNPIHIGHLAMAQKALEEYSLDKVIFIPCRVPPHKRVSNMAPACDRLKMVRLAIQGNPHFEASDFEINKSGKSFTVDTVRYFREHIPMQTGLYFIVGGDNSHELHTWKEIDQIVKMVIFIVVNRPGHKRRVPKGIKHISITMPGVQVSASYIRNCISSGKSAQYFLRDNVVQYIKKKKLYQKP